MAMTPEQLQKALGDVLATVTTLQEQVAALVARAAGEQTPGQRAKALVKQFAALWQVRYQGSEYVIDWGKDMATMTRLAKKLEDDEIVRRMKLFLDSSDQFVKSAGHPLSLFGSSVNKYAGPASGARSLFETPRPAFDDAVGRLLLHCDPSVPTAFRAYFEGATLEGDLLVLNVSEEQANYVRAKLLPGLEKVHGRPLTVYPTPF
jgi:hypothetical protein